MCAAGCRGGELVLLYGFPFATAVKVQKSNHHHWDQSSSNYCHPPHASHSKTWSSPSHPHNQQDHCKCKLSLVTAVLLARHHSRSLFSPARLFHLIPPTLLPHLFCCLFPGLCAAAAAVVKAVMWCIRSLYQCLLTALASGGFSPSSTATSGFSSQGSNTLPCSVPPMAPTSPRSTTSKRRNRKKDHKSSRMTKPPVSFYFIRKGQYNQMTKKHIFLLLNGNLLHCPVYINENRLNNRNTSATKCVLQQFRYKTLYPPWWWDLLQDCHLSQITDFNMQPIGLESKSDVKCVL